MNLCVLSKQWHVSNGIIRKHCNETGFSHSELLKSDQSDLIPFITYADVCDTYKLNCSTLIRWAGYFDKWQTHGIQGVSL